MKEGFDVNLLNSGALMKKGYSFLIANIGKTVAVITLLVAALISFAEISFSGVGTENFTSTLIMMLIASYVMYFSLEDAGEKLGKETEEYASAVKEYNDRREKIGGDDISELRRFCLDYRNEELEYRQKNEIFSLGYTREEFDAYRRGEKMSAKATRELRRIDKMSRADLSVSNLLSRETRGGKSELKNPEANKVLSMLIRLIPSTVCMIFTVSVIVCAKEDMSFGSVLESVIKLSTLPVIGLRGYAAGYEYTMGAEIAWLKTKASLLDAFLKRKDRE